MKILVLSDSHGRMDAMEWAAAKEQPDQIFHLGDYLRDAERLQRHFPRIPCRCVTGNCDFGQTGLSEILDEEAGVRIFACHGHRYSVKNGLTALSFAAREKGAGLCLFGHTHMAVCEESGGILYLNPGSCGGLRPTYGIAILENGRVQGCIRSVEEEL